MLKANGHMYTSHVRMLTTEHSTVTSVFEYADVMTLRLEIELREGREVIYTVLLLTSLIRLRAKWRICCIPGHSAIHGRMQLYSRSQTRDPNECTKPHSGLKCVYKHLIRNSDAWTKPNSGLEMNIQKTQDSSDICMYNVKLGIGMNIQKLRIEVNVLLETLD